VAVNYSSDREGTERVAQAITYNRGEALAVGAAVSKVGAYQRDEERYAARAFHPIAKLACQMRRVHPDR
jgi:hypothetical protein